MICLFVTDKKFELEEDLLKMISKKNYNADLRNLSDKNLIIESEKEMYFDEKALGNKSIRDETLIRLQKSPAILAGSLMKKSFTNTRWFSYAPIELYDGLEIRLEKEQAGKVINLIFDESFAIAVKLFQYERISTKQHVFLLFKGLN